MAMSVEDQEELITKFQKHPNDRGSTAVQIALLTGRIGQLTEHLRNHPNDNHSRMGLLRWVGKRRRLLRYLSGKDPETYRRLIAELGLRG